MSGKAGLTRREFSLSIALAAGAAPLMGCASLTHGLAPRGYPPLLDHLVWLARDLEGACRRFEELSGIAPSYGGEHPSGTHNAIVSLGPDVYLEIVAPQPGVTAGSPWIAAALERPEPHLLTYCMRPSERLETLAERARAAGMRVLGPSSGSRIAPDGRTLSWRLLIPVGADDPARSIPFFIDWGDSEHPARSAKAAASLRSFRIGNPDPARVNPVLALLAPGVLAVSTDAPYLSATVSSPKGVVTLTS